MRLGIFARTFARPTVEEVFAAVRAHELNCVQFNMSCASLPTLPDEIPPSLISRIHEAALSWNIEIAAISGTYNMIHPDLRMRESGLRRLRILAKACRGLDTGVITLCTGTRDAEDMWRWHPENASTAAWSDLLQAMEGALRIAEEEQVTLAFEPEPANVVSNAVQGKALLDTMQSPRLKVVIDPANLIVPDDQGQQKSEVLDKAFDLLGNSIVIAHAKDRDEHGAVCAAGTGIINYHQYIHLLQRIDFAGPLILHGLDETEVDAAVEFLSP